ncbi:ankyrin repeat domain-containing protein [Rosistilla oblonga]|uniref:ankyrin repeat domain-containing protein n=1 Tax=Rosistilla oblonga TaxID=2527990 RepID=UPI003A96EBD7
MSRLMEPIEHVFVRHCLPAKHGDFERVKPLLRSGFDHSGSMSTAGLPALEACEANGRWTIAWEQAGSAWVLLDSNAAAAETLYRDNCKSRRSEVVWVRRTGDQFDFHWTAARKCVVDFRDHPGQPPIVKHDAANEAIAKCLQAGNGQEVFAALCKVAELLVPAESISVATQRFRIVPPRGRRARKSLGDFVIFSAPGLAPGENEAADRLAEAIDVGDVSALRQSIADGAPLDQLPDRSLSPLLLALYRCGTTKTWRQCAQALIDAGCRIDPADGEPLVIEACSHLLSEQASVEILQLLIENGADLNVRDRRGMTALDLSASRRRNQVVAFLIEHGADPTIETRQDQTIVDEIRNRVDQAAQYGKRSEYAETLELLTGVPYQVPDSLQLSDAVRSEAERFLSIVEARHLRKLLPKTVEIQPIKASRLNNFETFKPWCRELQQLGFVEACHVMTCVALQVPQTILTDPRRRFDAILGDDGPLAPGGLRLEIVASAADGRIISVANKALQDDPRWRPTFLQSHVLEGRPVSELVDRMVELTKGIQLNEIAVDQAVDRYRGGVERLIEGMRQRTREVERSRIVDADGNVPRFERIGVYLQPRLGSQPDDLTSFSVAQSAERSFADDSGESKRSDPGRDLCETVRDAAVLAALDHLQMAGALHDESKIAAGIDAGMAFFQAFQDPSSEARDRWLAEPLCLVLALASSRGRWDAVQAIAGGLSAEFLDASARFPDDPPVAMAEVLALVANRFGNQTSWDDSQLFASIAASRSKHAQLLAAVISAIDTADAAGFELAFTESLRHASKRKPRADWSFDLDRAVAWYETILWHLAAHRELPLPKLSEKQSDWLLCCEAPARGSD